VIYYGPHITNPQLDLPDDALKELDGVTSILA
jgi:hypothetical protein